MTRISSAVTFYNNEGGRVMKPTFLHFKKEKVPERTIYNIISKYVTYNITEIRASPPRLFDRKRRSLCHSLSEPAQHSSRPPNRIAVVHYRTVRL